MLMEALQRALDDTQRKGAKAGIEFFQPRDEQRVLVEGLLKELAVASPRSNSASSMEERTRLNIALNILQNRNRKS